MSKHKRVLRDGQTARGPARWARAAGNAFERPNSREAKTYLDRVTNAHKLRTFYEQIDNSAFAHWKCTWTWDNVERISTPVGRERIQYYTCSLYCAAMQVQLDDGIRTYDELLAFFKAAQVTLDRGYPARTVRCQVCGTSINP